MAEPNSGWLTILPSGRWYLKDYKLLPYVGGRRNILTQLGPYALKKKITLGSSPINPGRIRTKIRWAYKNGRLSLGPIIGILTVSDGDVGTFRGNRENFKDIFLSGKQLGALVYVFTPNGIDWSTKKIRGFLYDEKTDTWSETMLPFPHVVYNRIPTRKLEKRSDASHALDQISATKNVTLFNRCFFDKQTLFQTLQGRSEVTSFLPDTQKLINLQQFKLFCSQHSFIYLKPVLGKAGQGIMRLEVSGKRWCLKRVYEQKSITRFFPSIEKVWHFVKKRIKNKPYILQQGIPLAKFKGRPFDVRVLVQKNGSGEWAVTGVGIRRAGAKSITTHVPRGGMILSTSTVLTQMFNEQADAIYKKIEETSLAIAKNLNQEIESLAEMSMDLGLTQEGKLWFFEANAKPEKFDEPAIRRGSLANLIQYAQYVSRLGNNRKSIAG